MVFSHFLGTTILVPDIKLGVFVAQSTQEVR